MTEKDSLSKRLPSPGYCQMKSRYLALRDSGLAREDDDDDDDDEK